MDRVYATKLTRILSNVNAIVVSDGVFVHGHLPPIAHEPRHPMSDQPQKSSPAIIVTAFRDSDSEAVGGIHPDLSIASSLHTARLGAPEGRSGHPLWRPYARP